jgi:hypothetical protein
MMVCSLCHCELASEANARHHMRMCHGVADYGVPSRDAAGEDLYSELRRVLELAVHQAASGKGRERHAVEGERFEDQKIVQLGIWMRSAQGQLYQAAKKATEASRLKPGAARADILGAINYLAAAFLVIEQLERADADAEPKQAPATEPRHPQQHDAIRDRG